MSPWPSARETHLPTPPPAAVETADGAWLPCPAGVDPLGRRAGRGADAPRPGAHYLKWPDDSRFGAAPALGAPCGGTAIPRRGRRAPVRGRTARDRDGTAPRWAARCRSETAPARGPGGRGPALKAFGEASSRRLGLRLEERVRRERLGLHPEGDEVVYEHAQYSHQARRRRPGNFV